MHDYKLATQLYRIAQEAVANAIKHSHANLIEISLNLMDGMIVLAIRDDGVGITDHHNPEKITGMGLLTMSHRARMIGGSLVIERDKAKGTIVRCSVPNISVPDSDS